MTETVRLLRDLVALPSVNPSFLPRGHARAGEHRVADFLAVTAARAGLEVEFQPVAEGRANLIAVLTPAAGIKTRVALAPHMDTVNGSDDQFTPRLKSGRVYGRGACDTKGSVAAMLSAMIRVGRSRNRPKSTEIVFAALVDEEQVQAGSRALIASGFRADLAIVGEPTNAKLVTAHKGSLWLRLVTQGKSAHGSRPRLGVNAVHEMARVVDFMETTYAELLATRLHPLLGSATSSVGVIQGGTQPNIVPDRCSIQVDRRTLPGETEQSVLAEIRTLLRSVKLRAEVESLKPCSCLPLETDPKIPLVKGFLAATGQRKPLGMHYYCDAAVLAESGTPATVFGPGDIAQAHTADEWVSVESLESATRKLTTFLQSLP